MKPKLPLRTRILIVLSALAGITVMGALVMIWHTYRMDDLLTAIIEKNVGGFEAAEALEGALVNQKGFSYFLPTQI